MEAARLRSSTYSTRELTHQARTSLGPAQCSCGRRHRMRLVEQALVVHESGASLVAHGRARCGSTVSVWTGL